MIKEIGKYFRLFSIISKALCHDKGNREIFPAIFYNFEGSMP